MAASKKLRVRKPSLEARLWAIEELAGELGRLVAVIREARADMASKKCVKPERVSRSEAYLSLKRSAPGGVEAALFKLADAYVLRDLRSRQRVFGIALARVATDFIREPKADNAAAIRALRRASKVRGDAVLDAEAANIASLCTAARGRNSEKERVKRVYNFLAQHSMALPKPDTRTGLRGGLRDLVDHVLSDRI